MNEIHLQIVSDNTESAPPSLPVHFIGFIGSAVGRGVRWAVYYVIASVTFMAIIYGLGWAYLEMNPERKAQWNQLSSMASSLGTMLPMLTGISTTPASGNTASTTATNADASALLPLLQAVKTPEKSQAPKPAKTIVITPEALAPIPVNLHPLAKAVAGTAQREKFWASISKDKVGERGEGALTILQRALASGNPRLVEAAKQCLRNIGTEEALQILEKAEQ